MVITLGNFGVEGETFFFFFNLTMPGLSCSMWDLAPRSGIETRPPELQVQSLNHQPTRQVWGIFKSSHQIASFSSYRSRKQGHDGKWDWPFEESEKQTKQTLQSVVQKYCRTISKMTTEKNGCLPEIRYRHGSQQTTGIEGIRGNTDIEHSQWEGRGGKCQKRQKGQWRKVKVLHSTERGA